MHIDPEQVDKVIEQRRSVFPAEYSGERVDDAIVQKILQNGNCAPTHKITEPWRFVVFTREGLSRLADFQSDLYKTVTTADGTFKEERFQNLLTKPLLSSHIIAVCMKRDDRRSVPEIEEIGAVFCAIENMYLTATAYGVGAYLSTGGITYFDGAKPFFGLADSDKLLGFFHIGIPKKSVLSRKKGSLDERVRWVTG